MKKNELTFSQIRGRVVAAPELKSTKTGKTVATFTLAYDTPQKTDKEGSHTSFVQVEMWEKIAEVFSPLLSKGLEVVIQGNFVQNRWKDENGKNRSNFRFNASLVSIIDIHYQAQEKAA